MKSALSTIVCSLFFIACTLSEADKLSVLPKAKGKPGEIILSMDSAKWASVLGDEIRKTFKPVVEGLPRGEVLFSVRYVDTLWDIARKYDGLTIAKIKSLNNMTSSKIKPGQQLIILLF